jgi:hypothetical protein
MYCTRSLYWMTAGEPGTKDPHLPALGWTALWSWMTAAGCWAGKGDSIFL